MAKKKTVTKTKYDNLNTKYKSVQSDLKSVKADLQAMTEAYNEATNATAIARENMRIQHEYNSQEAKVAREFNAEESQKARDWQTEMSNTSHQREVFDLQAAGLNPVLSANSGAQSYTTSAASATPATGSIDSSVNAVANMYNTERTNANAVKLANMNNDVNLQIAKLNYKVGIKSANSAVAAARASAAAAVTAAGINAQASNYAADMNYKSQALSPQKAVVEGIKKIGSLPGKLFGKKIK